MRVLVKYMAQLRQAAGVAAEEVVLEKPCPVADLLVRLAGHRTDLFRRLLLDGAGRPQPTLLLFVGDRQVADAARAVLQDGDCVTVLTPIAGG